MKQQHTLDLKESYATEYKYVTSAFSVVLVHQNTNGFSKSATFYQGPNIIFVLLMSIRTIVPPVTEVHSFR